MKLLSLIIATLFMPQDSSSYIFNLKDPNWYVVNDGVMGGLSKGNITINAAGNALFEGYVTTDNNGGFSSVRHTFDKRNTSNYDHVVLKIKGDGKSYQFRIKEKSSQRYSYVSTFKTSGEWETIKLPLTEFYPRFRGNKLDLPNFSGASMEEIAILIGNKKKESFSLEIESIALV